jgi:hypothetical protein
MSEPAADVEVPGLEPQRIVTTIQEAIEATGLNTPDGQGGLTLHEVSIEMMAVTEVHNGLKPKFEVPWVGWEVGATASNSHLQGHTITMTLRTPWAPQEAGTDTQLKGAGDVDLSVSLPAAFASMREMLEQAREGHTALQLNQSSVVFEFDVSKQRKLELAVPSTERNRRAAVTVKFQFGAPRGGDT